jgi:Tol biopolymer transport system component
MGFEPRVYVTGFDGQGVNGPNPVSLPGSQPMFSRDGESLIVNGTAGDLSGVFLIDPGGQTPQVLLDRDSAHWPVLSPDGQEVLFADASLNNILMSWKSDGSVSEVQANNTSILVRSLLWSDDNRIVFHSCASWAGQPGDCGVWVSDVTNIDPVRIVVGNEDWPMDVGDGLLTYMSAQDGDWDIYTISLGGGQPENITDNDGQDGLAAIAPDEKSIAYLSNESGAWALWTVTLRDKEKQHWFDIDPERGTVDVNNWSSERMSWGR